MRALVWKELREIAGVTALALGCYAALVVSLVNARAFEWLPVMPRGTSGVPFVHGSFTHPFVLISVLFAVALGFRQSAWESAKGTYLYLLHLPRSREAIFSTKMAVGGAVLLASAALPIVGYAAWAAVPGHHAGPFEWSMTESAWQAALMMPAVYLGAFLSGIRPGWWFGSRLLPLAGAASLVLLVNMVPVWWLVGLPLTATLCVLLAGSVCYAARVRDYA